MANEVYGPEGNTQGPRQGLEEEGIKRLAACRIWKSLWDLDLREAYFFTTPQRQRQIQSYAQPPQQRLLDSAELNTDIGFELAGDFATEVINTYLPEEQNWCESGPGETVDDETFAAVADNVRKVDAQVFRSIKASNFYAELSKAFDPDLSVGTVGLWIDRMHPSEPITCLTVPIREFEINLGPNGEIDDRFVVRYTRNSYVRKLLGEEIWAKVKEETKKNIDDKPAQKTELRWGYWRLWDDHSDEVWQHVVYVGKELVHDALMRGEGCCPVIIMRWNPNPDWPWGHGPVLQYMPTLRQVDELEYQRIEHAELSMRPPTGYPDDSFAAIEQGLEPGMAYPLRVGSEGAIKPIYTPPPPDAANYAYEEKEHRLRKGFFVDFPQQTGDTPPTLGQWLDEMARAQRRIGRPGLPFWREGPAKIFIRYKYLLRKAGVIPDVQHNGKSIALMPRNPSQRAAEQQEIATAVQALELLAQFFPEEFKVQIDGKKTMDAILTKMRVTALVKFRDQKQIATAIDQISKLVGGTPPGGKPAAAPPAMAQA